MSLTDEDLNRIFRQSFKLIDSKLTPAQKDFGRAIESATAAPLLERIAEFEQQLERAKAIEAAAINLVKVKGRYHTEQAFKALAEVISKEQA